MIPVILKGETSKPIQLTLREGYVYSGCVLAVCFRGVMKTFTDLVAGGTVELLYTAEETSTFPLGTGKVGLSIQNSAGDICFMPWAKIKVTDSPAEVHDAQITIDPATLNVSDATSKDSLGAVKSKLNAVLAFLRGLSSLAVLALPLYALSDVAPLTAPLDDIPGDTPLMTNVLPYVDAKVAAVPAPDYSTNNPQLVATIGEVAATGTVRRAQTYGTPTRWTDATGCVWEVVTDAWIDHATGNIFRNGTSIFPSEVTDGEMRGYLTYDSNAMGYLGLEGEGWYYNGENTSGTPSTVLTGGPDATSLDNGRFTFGFTNLVGRVALTNDIPDVSGYATPAAVDAKISTNNAAFVSAVLAVPLTGADAGDLAEIAEYGGYGTVGAALLALIAGLAALKRRVTSAETSLALKANLTDLPYRLVEPGKWEFSGLPSGASSASIEWTTVGAGHCWVLTYILDGDVISTLASSDYRENALSVVFYYDGGKTVTATRASLPGHLLDRAGNRVEVSGDTTLTLPAANPGYLRDFLVRLEISGSTVPTITFAAPTGETITYETDGDEFPVPDEAVDWLYSFTESCVAHKFAVSLKKVNTVAQGGV